MVYRKITEEQYMKLVNEVRLPASALSAVPARAPALPPPARHMYFGISEFAFKIVSKRSGFCFFRA